MGHDGVLSVDYSGIVAALVEHTHLYAENVGEVDCSVHGSLVRADDHQMFLIYP